MVQNEYLEIFLELGLIGGVLVVMMLLGIFKKANRTRYLWPVAVAFAVQWWFFSGYPNALHIFVVLGFIYAYTARKKQT